MRNSWKHAEHSLGEAQDEPGPKLTTLSKTGADVCYPDLKHELAAFTKVPDPRRRPFGGRFCHDGANCQSARSDRVTSGRTPLNRAVNVVEGAGAYRSQSAPASRVRSNVGVPLTQHLVLDYEHDNRAQHRDDHTPDVEPVDTRRAR